MMAFLKALVLLPVAIVVVLLAVANRQVVTVSFDPFSKGPPEIAATVPLFALIFAAVVIGILIGGVGAASVFKAVYLDKRELKCACVGGASNVPLGFVSLTENLVMVGMAAWMVLWAM